MTVKKKQKKQPNLHSRIVSLVMEKGPVKLGVMVKALGASYQSLNTEALELRRLGVLSKDSEGVWSLVPGVDPEMFGIEVTIADQVGSNARDATALEPSESEGPGTFRDQFRDLLRSVGVGTAAEAIADLYVNGDYIWDAHWLHRVLADYVRGFVTEGQCKLIMGYWTRKNGIPYEYEDFFED